MVLVIFITSQGTVALIFGPKIYLAYFNTDDGNNIWRFVRTGESSGSGSQSKSAQKQTGTHDSQFKYHGGGS
jgi:hypothetical protein